MTRPPIPDALPRPDVAPPEPYALARPQRRVLGNGLTVLAYDLPGQYVVSVRLAIPLPLRLEPRDKEGVATIMARTLDEGTQRHTSAEFARLLERRGVALGAGVGDSGLSVDIDVAKRHLAYALDLLRQCLLEPAFPQADVARHVATRLAEIEQERSVASHRAARELAATFFDPSARAARPSGGSLDTVAGITRADVEGMHARHVAPSRATLVMAGDLSGLDAFTLVEDTLGARADPAAYPDPGPWQASPEAADRARIVLVDRPGSVQTEIIVAGSGPDRHVAEGWAPYPVLGFVVGGSPTARLDALLREEKGYTYGIRAGFRPRRVGGLFVASGAVRSEVTAEAVRDMLAVLDAARDGFTDAECEQGRQYLVRTAPARYATADTIADEAAGLSYDGLTTDFTTNTLAEIARMTTQRLDAAYRRFVDGRWTVVLVGDAAAVAPGLRALADVTVVAN